MSWSQDFEASNNEGSESETKDQSSCSVKANLVEDVAWKKNTIFACQKANYSFGRKLTIVESNKFEEIVDSQENWVSEFPFSYWDSGGNNWCRN